jgi:hypothetical protein
VSASSGWTSGVLALTAGASGVGLALLWVEKGNIDVAHKSEKVPTARQRE